MIKRCVVTIAIGKSYYLNLAENLLLSFLMWNNHNDIHFMILTDNVLYFNRFKGQTKIHIIELVLDNYNKSFTSKLNLYERKIAEENLFIDCDCLIYKSLDHVFEAFKGKNFSAIGNNITSGEFFCDVKETISNFKLSALPKFVGSIYYFKKNDTTQNIFEKASELKRRYDELGFIRLRNKENEEPLLAVAMALNYETVLANDGTIKADAMYYTNIQCNVIQGLASLTVPLKIAQNETIPFSAMPSIVHFNANFSESWAYKADVFRLSHTVYNPALLNGIIFFKFKAVANINYIFKTVLRPIYRLFFGFRKIKDSQRT